MRHLFRNLEIAEPLLEFDDAMSLVFRIFRIEKQVGTPGELDTVLFRQVVGCLLYTSGKYLIPLSEEYCYTPKPN